MLSMLRTALVAAALCVAAALPAAAQQATPAPAPTETVPPAVADTVQELQTTVEGLKRDLQKMTESARQSAHDLLNRQSPFVVTTDQLAVIAASAVAGAIVIDLLGGGGLATLTGAVIGGVAGHWIYTQPVPAPAVRG